MVECSAGSVCGSSTLVGGWAGVLPPRCQCLLGSLPGLPTYLPARLDSLDPSVSLPADTYLFNDPYKYLKSELFSQFQFISMRDGGDVSRVCWAEACCPPVRGALGALCWL